MPHPVLEVAARQRAQLLAGERQVATRLVGAYGRAYARMGNQIAALEQQIAASGPLGRASAARLTSLRNLQTQIAAEINRFGAYADEEITRNAFAAIELGISNSRQLTFSYFTSPAAREALTAAWDVLPAEAVETMLGFIGADSPLHTGLVRRMGAALAERTGDALIDGMVMGMNPRQVAAIIRRELGQGLTWALNTARTAQVWSYREAARASYMANSDIVDGWIWYASLGRRTCMSCVSKHGSRHRVDEVLNDHHSGRCVALPEVPLARRIGIALPTIESGEEWFARQSEADQMAQMGLAKFDAWRAGAFTLNQLSESYQDPVYGEMLREASLVGLLGENAEQYYRR